MVPYDPISALEKAEAKKRAKLQSFKSIYIIWYNDLFRSFACSFDLW